MDVAKFLSGFIGAGLSVFTANFVDSAKIHDLAGFVPAIGIGTLFLFLSLLLYLTTMCCYDSLFNAEALLERKLCGNGKSPTLDCCSSPKFCFLDPLSEYAPCLAMAVYSSNIFFGYWLVHNRHGHFRARPRSYRKIFSDCSNFIAGFRSRYRSESSSETQNCSSISD